MTIPSGNGQTRGPESAGGPGTPLPGTRPSRARANDERNKNFLGQTPVADQAGFGEEPMVREANHFGSSNEWPSDFHNKPVDLMAMGDPGETFGGS